MRDFIGRRFGYYLIIAAFIVPMCLACVPARADGNNEVTPAVADPVIAAAGDIACDPTSSSFNSGDGGSSSCRQKYTSDLLIDAGLAAILPLGDVQYYCGGYQAFLQSYDLSWGRVKSISRPVVGNHEYLTSNGTDCTNDNEGAAGYFRYFGSAAGNPSQGYYSYDIGTWHLIALNSSCSKAGGCSSTSPQGKWLAADLAAHSNYCTLAYWHIPLFSSGGRALENTKPIWQTLYEYDVDVVLTGHDHIYERFAPQTADGTLDAARGIREFVVGTGGSNHSSITTIAANSEVRNTDTFGVLKLTLRPTSYDWEFVPEAGKTFTDSGTANCHGNASPAGSPPATALPANTFSFAPVADAYVNASSPGDNYGTSAVLRADASPDVHSYLRFDVQGLSGTVTRATLRVFANSASNLDCTVHRVDDNTWDESTINYGNAPTLGSALGSSGSFDAGMWISMDVTASITGNGTYNLALTTPSDTAISIASREAGADAPQLIIETTP